MDRKPNFIETFNNAFSKEWCENCINEFLMAEKNKKTLTRSKAENTNPLIKQDSFINLEVHRESSYQKIITDFKEIFFKIVYPQYNELYGALAFAGPHTIEGFKIQKTEIGQGYHIWHFENDSLEHSRRLLAYSLSLNDVAEGGETEFLYQNYRLQQKQGSLTIFPASFTHTHRGNPPLSNTKYIMTGWISFISNNQTDSQ